MRKTETAWKPRRAKATKATLPAHAAVAAAPEGAHWAKNVDRD